jgi:Ca2+-transporting ATPase
MAKRNALIRKLSSVETLGSVTVICSDKTGTLTRNEMTVQEIVAGNERFRVTGIGYAPYGQFHKLTNILASSLPSPLWDKDQGDEEHGLIDPSAHPDLLRTLAIGLECNNSKLNPPREEMGPWEVIGDPTEGALVAAAFKAGLQRISPEERVIYEIPFDPERKAMSVVVRDQHGSFLMYTKGAPEVILSKCTAVLSAGKVEPLLTARRNQILEQNKEMASRALRVLGLAYREIPLEQATVCDEHDLIFAGLAGMMDPPRDEVQGAVHKCHKAGIRPVMITGDHPATALAIAQELQMAAGGDAAVTGPELDAMSDEQLAQLVEQFPVYARVSAEHKLRIVRAWKSRGHVVAMTGDGVNDAPAVKAADIGIAMGLTGTEVTRQASSMVLTDDNFASIVNAVEEGRCIYDNIQKVLFYLLSCNTGEMLLVLLASLFGWPVPLVPIQLLWINLITDGLPALALSMEKPERGIMSRRPRSPREPMLSLRSGVTILGQGVLVGGVTLIAFGIIYFANSNTSETVGRARTAAFCVLVYGELLRALTARSQTLTVASLGFFSNPHLLGAVLISVLLQLSVVVVPLVRPIFGTQRQFLWEWGLIFCLALTPAAIIEGLKVWNRRCRLDLVGGE